MKLEFLRARTKHFMHSHYRVLYSTFWFSSDSLPCLQMASRPKQAVSLALVGSLQSMPLQLLDFALTRQHQLPLRILSSKLRTPLPEFSYFSAAVRKPFSTSLLTLLNNEMSLFFESLQKWTSHHSSWITQVFIQLVELRWGWSDSRHLLTCDFKYMGLMAATQGWTQRLTFYFVL